MQPHCPRQRCGQRGEDRQAVLGLAEEEDIVAEMTAQSGVERLQAVKHRVVEREHVRQGQRVDREGDSQQQPRALAQLIEQVVNASQ
jgi:hypothetical protein